MPNHKACTICLERLPMAQFYRNGTDRNGQISYHSQCKVCQLARKAPNPEYQRRYQKEYQARRLLCLVERRVHSWVSNHNTRARQGNIQGRLTYQGLRDKLKFAGARCEDCGLEGLESLQLDHVKPLAHGGTNWLANTDFVCVDCHRLRTVAKFPSCVDDCLGSSVEI